MTNQQKRAIGGPENLEAFADRPGLLHMAKRSRHATEAGIRSSLPKQPMTSEASREEPLRQADIPLGADWKAFNV